MKKKSKWVMAGVSGAAVLGYLGIIATDLLELSCGKQVESDEMESVKKDIEEKYGVSVKIVSDDTGASYDPETKTIELTKNILACFHEIGHVETHQAFEKMLPNGIGDDIYQGLTSMNIPLSIMMGISGIIISAYGNEKAKKMGPGIAMSGGLLMAAQEAVASYIAVKKLKESAGSWEEGLKEGSDMLYWLGGYFSIPLALGISALVVKSKTAEGKSEP